MSFDSIHKEMKSLTDNKIEMNLDLIKKFNNLCTKTFGETLDLSKGNPQEFMQIMATITLIAEQITPELINSGNERIWFTISKVAIDLLMFKESNIFADAVIKFNNKNKLVWFYKGRYFEREKNYEEAEKSFKKALEIDKEYYVAWYQIASMYEKIDLEKAYQKYLKIVELFPRSMSGWKRLEEVGGKLGHYEVAMKAQKVSFDLSNDPNRKM
jgi:tetratricopeptide (TPR) repeat protein